MISIAVTLSDDKKEKYQSHVATIVIEHEVDLADELIGMTDVFGPTESEYSVYGGTKEHVIKNACLFIQQISVDYGERYSNEFANAIDKLIEQGG